MPTDVLPTRDDLEITFGPYRCLPGQRLLLHAGRPLPLGSRAREILFVLLEHAGEIVKKSELIGRVWPDTVVEEGTLRVHIAALRKALGEGQDGLRYVENVTGHGYRFIAPVIRGAPPTNRETAPIAHALPGDLTHGGAFPLTRMVGRTALVEALAARLPHKRFMTIVGPGGIGKTTVAMAIADRLRASYAHGECVVDLASVRDPELISGTIASVLGFATVSQDAIPNV